MANLVFEHPTLQKNRDVFGFFFDFLKKILLEILAS
jgi:hypothetical protein